MSRKSQDPFWLFTLRLKPFTNRPGIGIEAIKTGRDKGRTRYSLRVTHNRKEIFAHNTVLVGSFSPCHSIDGHEARAHAVAHVALKPGDADDEFFKEYTKEQIDFVNEFSEQLQIYYQKGR